MVWRIADLGMGGGDWGMSSLRRHMEAGRVFLVSLEQ